MLFRSRFIKKIFIYCQSAHGLICRVADNDGEFLLIEAANDLPDWAESDSTCLQRVCNSISSFLSILANKS